MKKFTYYKKHRHRRSPFVIREYVFFGKSIYITATISYPMKMSI